MRNDIAVDINNLIYRYCSRSDTDIPDFKLDRFAALINNIYIVSDTTPMDVDHAANRNNSPTLLHWAQSAYTVVKRWR